MDNNFPGRSVVRVAGAVALWLLTFTAIAQESGSVSGVVVSTWDGTPLAGATVTVRGTTLAAQTGADGRFQLSGVPAGEQVLRFSKPGFAAVAVTEIRVLPGQTTTVNGNLKPEFHELDEFEITAEEFTQQTEQIMIERQQATSMLEAIGSEQFSKKGLGDAAEALGQVSGASIADGKFAVIRGLADRYTSTTLNGTDMPSADPDRRAAQLDLIPSQFISRMDVYKTFTPDLPGGFVGGAIDIVTRRFPDEFTFTAAAGVAYNSQSNLRDDYLQGDQSSTDWRAQDDGLRAFPNPAARENFQPLFAPFPGDSGLNKAFSMSLGDSFTVLGRRVGYMGGLNYKTEFQQYDNGKVGKYEGATAQVLDKDDIRSVTEYTWSAMAGVGIELLKGHEIGFNFMKIQTAEDEARSLVGVDNGALPEIEPTPTLYQSILHWTERSVDYYQLTGNHLFEELGNVRLDWAGSMASATQDEPDQRLFQYADFGEESQPLRYLMDIQSRPSKPLRMWRSIEEDGSSVRADLTLPLPSYNSKANALKTGFWMSQSERAFDSTIYEVFVSSPVTQHPFTQTGDPAGFLAATNLPYVTYRPFPSGNWVYDGEQAIDAYYLMGDWATFEWLRVVGGARIESTHIEVTATDLSTGRVIPPNPIDQTDLLPGVGLTFFLRENLLLRLGYSQTVARPAYREIGRAEIFDIAENKTIRGNPDLQMAAAENLDARLEWFPRPGEIVSLSLYLKQIDGPIEQVAIDPSLISYRNSQSADVQGLELEWQTSLDRISSHLREFTFGLNGSYIKSTVPLTQVELVNRENWQDPATDRPLYDQPEFTFNTDLTWDHKASGTMANISLGIVGRRLVVAGVSTPDEYEEPAPQLNFIVSQKLGKHWKLRFSAKNLLDPTFETTQTWPRYYEPGVVDIAGRTTVLRSYTKGITFGMALSCEF